MRRIGSLITILVMLWLISTLFPKAADVALAPIRMAQGLGASVELANMRKVVLAFQVQQGRYPTVEEMGRLVDENFDAKGRSPRYDMWGTPYYYEYNPHGFLLRSAGPDKTLATGDDITLQWRDNK